MAYRAKNRTYEFVTPDEYKVLRTRYDQFLQNLDKDAPVITVYGPLRQSQIDQLTVIREVSIELQRKKDEDILKAKQAAEEASRAEAEEKKENSVVSAEENEGQEDNNETEKKDIN